MLSLTIVTNRAGHSRTSLPERSYRILVVLIIQRSGSGNVGHQGGKTEFLEKQRVVFIGKPSLLMRKPIASKREILKTKIVFNGWDSDSDCCTVENSLCFHLKYSLL
jgi:hypothetical protein